ncbi:recombinase family protein [Kozakia baliensis]|uniref:recombinase family protein n=1 Tax=Kozakia baliensis TaxID=153496 RepID=UPI000689B06B|nr:recombinase family protein [Kozakia baliensis]
MTVYGYARVSTPRQNVTPQVKALRAAGIPKDRIFQDKSTGRAVNRPGLNGLLSVVQPDDIVMCWKVDRLGRTFLECAQVAAGLLERKVIIRALTGGADSSTPEGRFMLHALLAVAELETELRAERQAAGLEDAREKRRKAGRQGIGGGRRPTLTSRQREHARQMKAEGRSITEIQRLFNVSRGVAQRAAQGRETVLDDLDFKKPEDRERLRRANAMMAAIEARQIDIEEAIKAA